MSVDARLRPTLGAAVGGEGMRVLQLGCLSGPGAADQPCLIHSRGALKVAAPRASQTRTYLIHHYTHKYKRTHLKTNTACAVRGHSPLTRIANCAELTECVLFFRQHTLTRMKLSSKLFALSFWWRRKKQTTTHNITRHPLSLPYDTRTCRRPRLSLTAHPSPHHRATYARAAQVLTPALRQTTHKHQSSHETRREKNV